MNPSTEARANHAHSPSPSPDADIQLPPSTLTPPQKRSNCAAQIVFLQNERNPAEGSNCLQSRGSLLVARLAYNLMRFRPCSNPGTWTRANFFESPWQFETHVLIPFRPHLLREAHTDTKLVHWGESCHVTNCKPPVPRIRCPLQSTL